MGTLVVKTDHDHAMRIGFNYVRDLGEDGRNAIVAEPIPRRVHAFGRHAGAAKPRGGRRQTERLASEVVRRDEQDLHASPFYKQRPTSNPQPPRSALSSPLRAIAKHIDHRLGP